MWTSLWNRRSTLAHRIDSFHWAPTFCALDMIAFLTDELRTVKFYPQRNYVPVMFQVAYFSWVYLHGSGWIAGRDMADMPSNHNAPLLVFDYLQVLRAYEDKSSETPHPSRAFMDDLVNAIDPHTLVRAADNALSHSESLVDDRLSAYINVLAIQMPLIGLQWYASLPAKALWDSLIRSSTMRTDDSLLGSWIDVYRCKTSMSAYAAVYLHFRTMISGIETGIIPLVSFSGYVFWNVLVCGLVVGHEAANLLRHAEGHCTCGDHEEFAEGTYRIAAIP
ncbi:hypothetical protein PENSPDRAFT_156328 [Peniophora sp. CONT]|nr:hypothetical protein PENSPDRAFT_156328 [Peniophora sp. CONT]